MTSSDKSPASVREALETALRTIAEMPLPEQDNMIAANMRQVAREALSAAPAVQPAAQWESVTVLPDGSAFAVMSFPLPKDHWLYADGPDAPPMPLRMGVDHPSRKEMVQAVWAAAKYAVRGATMCGKEMDFDPDALCQNMVVGLLGYFTPDGLSHDGSCDPDPAPPLFDFSPQPPAATQEERCTCSANPDYCKVHQS